MHSAPTALLLSRDLVAGLPAPGRVWTVPCQTAMASVIQVIGDAGNQPPAVQEPQDEGFS